MDKSMKKHEKDTKMTIKINKSMKTMKFGENHEIVRKNLEKHKICGKFLEHSRQS